MTASPEKNPKPAAAADGCRPRHLLIVDDHEMTCKQVQRILQSDALDVQFRTDAEQALKALEETSFSVVITDLRMPGLGGMELIRRIQERRIPVTVIVTTGHGSIDKAVDAIRLGAYDFLTKPVEAAHLWLVIDRALRDRALQDELATL